MSSVVLFCCVIILAITVLYLSKRLNSANNLIVTLKETGNLDIPSSAIEWIPIDKAPKFRSLLLAFDSYDCGWVYDMGFTTREGELYTTDGGGNNAKPYDKEHGAPYTWCLDTQNLLKVLEQHDKQ